MSIDEKILDLLDEEEIKLAISHMNINSLLNPMKHNQKMYSQQIKKLGRMDAKSPLVHKLLPGTVATLVKRQDVKYIEVVSKNIHEIQQNFEEYLYKNEMRSNLSHEVPESYSVLFWQYKERIDSSCDLPYFWLLLKLVDDELDENEQKRVEYCINQQGNHVQMATEHENKIDQLNQQHLTEIDQLKKKHSKEIKELQQEIRNLSNLIQGKKDSLEERWAKENEEKHAQRINSLDDEYAQRKDKLEKKYAEANSQLEQEYQERKAYIEVEIEEQTSRLNLDYERKKKSLDERIEKSKLNLETLQEKEQLLQTQVGTLETRKDELEAYIDNYFQKFEEHAIQLSLDALLKSKFTEAAFNLSGSEGTVKVQGINMDAHELLSYGGDPIENGEHVEPAEELEDMLTDLKDNIGLYFDDPYEIAKLVLVAQSLRKAILIDSFSAKKLGDSLSALTDGKSITILDLCDGKYALKEVIDYISNKSEKTILINGLIDRFDDKALSSICHNCQNKILIFSYAEKATLEMVSKAYFQYCIPMYFEEKMIFESDEPMVVCNQTYEKSLPEITSKECGQIYKKYFAKLFTEGYLTKSVALELSKYVAVYKAMTSGGKVSNLVKESIRFAISPKDEYEENQDILSDLI
ncbi:MAG: hypothetical protein MSA72_00620 [Lachnospiraceae bacterium]|nr:hypothetical protein [Lachnospiraceae bacterium]